MYKFQNDFDFGLSLQKRTIKCEPIQQRSIVMYADAKGKVVFGQQPQLGIQTGRFATETQACVQKICNDKNGNLTKGKKN